MVTLGSIVKLEAIEHPFTVLRIVPEWGLSSADVVRPPGRFFADQGALPVLVESSVDSRRLKSVPSPAQLLRALPDGDNWQAQTKRSVARLWAHYLLCEDPQRRLDAREVNTLAHQVSLVRHILDSAHLRRVLIADEVGLGKTVEAGLLLKELFESNPGLRVLYLAPARLVSNVRKEFDKLKLNFRQWSASDADARLSAESGMIDSRVIASIHRAVHGSHYDLIMKSQPWDVLVVDECHHLTDWAFGGGDPQEKYKLVRDLISRQKTGEGRVIFLSGTPHQGHVHRFENLLKLLRDGKESDAALSGRVIYRIKDEVRDWNDKPLFPKRQVNDPMFIDLTPRYELWLKQIHEFYKPTDGGRMSEARRRAAGWRCSQALQWAASSPNAGLGYLVRQAIRSGWDLSRSELKDAIGALRPYRHGTPDEPVNTLFERMRKEVGLQRTEPESGEAEDLEEALDDNDSAQQSAELAELLKQGLAVMKSSGDHKWTILAEKILDQAPGDKFVLFAQPIETVTALCAFLEKRYGEKPAIIIGGQSESERTIEIDHFWKSDGPRFLVSSRAGGEGINLQVARRLVHIDVPWNPMDLEQRVGRVHRFGSRQTIVVDTLVVKNSREARAYQLAREKLRVIVGTMVEPERFESVFSRVMCRLSPTELQELLNGMPQAELGAMERAKLSEMVQHGYSSWKAFHERFSEQQRHIRMLNPGLATWDDVASFLKEYAETEEASGFTAQSFEFAGDDVTAKDSAVTVLRFKEGGHYACGDYAGAPVFGPEGITPRQAGLNEPVIAKTLRQVAFPMQPTGAALLRWSDQVALPSHLRPTELGVIIMLRQTVRFDQGVACSEQGTSLHCFLIEGREKFSEVSAADKRALLKGLLTAVVTRSKTDKKKELESAVCEIESEIQENLSRITEDEAMSGIRYVVTPLLAALVDPSK